MNDITYDIMTPTARHMDSGKEALEDFKKRLAAISAAWPYDSSIAMTDEQLQAEGAVDVTPHYTYGLNLIVGVGGKQK